jgi:hypothetical protein
MIVDIGKKWVIGLCLKGSRIEGECIVAELILLIQRHVAADIAATVQVAITRVHGWKEVVIVAGKAC